MSSAPLQADSEVDLAERLKELRLRKRLSLGDVAREVGTSTAHLSAIETRRIENPGYKTVLRLADYYGVPLSRLIGRPDPAPVSVLPITFEDALNYLKDSASPESRAALIAFARLAAQVASPQNADSPRRRKRSDQTPSPASA